MPPRLGAPSHNIAKAHYEEIKVGCILYRVAPTVDDSDPIDEIWVVNTCAPKKLPLAEAKKLIPKGKVACVTRFAGAPLVGPHVVVRTPSEFYPCQEGDSKVRGA
jgi:hypothetical protein